MNAFYIYLAVSIYFLIGTWVAIIAKRSMVRGTADFFIANRTIGGIVAALTYSATTYSAFMLVGLAGLTYIGGVGAWGFELIYLAGLVLAAFFGPRFWLAGKKYNYITPSELLGDRYQSKTLQVVTALASIIFLIPYSAVQLSGISILLSGMSNNVIPFMAGLIIATIVTISWAYIGGMRAVAWTDSLQALIMIVVSTLALFFVVYGAFGGFGGLFANIETNYPKWLTVPGPGFFEHKAFVALALPWFFFCLSNPQVSQKLFIPRSLGALRTMVMGFLVFGFIYTFIAIMWGFSALALVPGLKNGDLATPSLLAMSIVPTFVALLVMVGIIAAAISTINGIILTLSSLVTQDIIKIINPNVEDSKLFTAGRIFVMVFSILAFLFATMKLGLIAVLSVASSAGLLVMVPAIVGAFFWKRGTAAGAVWSIVTGGIVAFWCQFGGIKPLGWGPGVWSGIVSTAIFILVSLLTSPPGEKAEEFISYVNGVLKEKNAI